MHWLAGVYYYQSDRSLEEQHFVATAPTIFNGEITVENRAVFGSLGFDITDRLNVTAELRYAEDTIGNFKTVRTLDPLIEQKFDSVSPRLTATYKLTPDSMVYANVALGNKPGVINADPRFPPELHFADEEEAWSYELGTKNTLFDGPADAERGGVLHRLDRPAAHRRPSRFPTGGTQSYIINAGKSEVKGVELELQTVIDGELRRPASRTRTRTPSSRS